MKTHAFYSKVLPLGCLCGALSHAALAVNGPTKPVTPYGDDGCWVSVFGGTEYDLPTARLNGPTFIHRFESGPVVNQDLQDVGGEAFLAEIGSLIVGPGARFEVYERENFGTRAMEFEPDQRVPDLAALDYHDKAKSARVRCEPLD